MCADIEPIEHLLFYYQNECKGLVDQMTTAARLAFHANVGICATQTFVSKKAKENLKFFGQLIRSSKNNAAVAAMDMPS